MKTTLNKTTTALIVLFLSCVLILSACGGSGSTKSAGDDNNNTGAAGAESAPEDGESTTTTDEEGNTVTVTTTTTDDGATVTVTETTDTEGNTVTVTTDEYNNVVNEDGSVTTPDGTTLEIADEGACVNESDSDIILESADAINTSIDTLLESGSACAGEEDIDASCIAAALVADYAITTDCGACFETMVSCFGTGTDDATCDAAFAECSGVTVSFADDGEHGSSSESTPEGEEGSEGEESAEGEEGAEGEGESEEGAEGEEGSEGGFTFKSTADCVTDGDDCFCSDSSNQEKINAVPTLFSTLEAAMTEGGSCASADPIGTCVDNLAQSEANVTANCSGCFGDYATCFSGGGSEATCGAAMTSCSGIIFEDEVAAE